jgi:hypothetical protein
VKAFQRYIKDTVNNKTYQLTVRPQLGGWLCTANLPIEVATARSK